MDAKISGLKHGGRKGIYTVSSYLPQDIHYHTEKTVTLQERETWQDTSSTKRSKSASPIRHRCHEALDTLNWERHSTSGLSANNA